jgi:hypothetical protein
MQNVIGQTNAGFEIVAQRAISTHPEDFHLSRVLGHDGESGKWVVWTYNAESNGYAGGYYYHGENAEQEAREKFVD